jgi:hypothetical protein
MISRRALFSFAALPAFVGKAATEPDARPAPAGSIFADPDFGPTAHTMMGASYYRGGNPGKVLSILARIKPQDFESAWSAYHEAGLEAQALAGQAQSKGQRVSAREAYFWAADYFYASMRFLDGTSDPSRMLPCWQEYATSWSAAAGLFDPPAERLEIPYAGSALTGWFLRPDASRKAHPLVIMNNGADGLENRMYVLGAAGALARGYNCLILNGPGQGDSLWVRKLYFRPDWEQVITPVVDAMLRRPDVDPKRIALIGVSQGGLWVPRALAFEHRIAAGVADPGVWDMRELWSKTFPPFLLDLLRREQKDDFNKILQMGVEKDKRAAMALRFRMRPYGASSYYDFFHAAGQYHVTDVAGRITCPMLVTDPEGEQFFPGQAQKLYDALQCPKTLIRFTHEQGAGEHCEAAAPGYRDYCIYNWLAEVLA